MDCAPLLVLAAVTVLRKSKELAIKEEAFDLYRAVITGTVTVVGFGVWIRAP